MIPACFAVTGTGPACSVLSLAVGDSGDRSLRPSHLRLGIILHPATRPVLPAQRHPLQGGGVVVRGGGGQGSGNPHGVVLRAVGTAADVGNTHVPGPDLVASEPCLHGRGGESVSHYITHSTTHSRSHTMNLPSPSPHLHRNHEFLLLGRDETFGVELGSVAAERGMERVVRLV